MTGDVSSLWFGDKASAMHLSKDSSTKRKVQPHCVFCENT